MKYFQKVAVKYRNTQKECGQYVVKKLLARYKSGKFSQSEALERDLDAERAQLEAGHALERELIRYRTALEQIANPSWAFDEAAKIAQKALEGLGW